MGKVARNSIKGYTYQQSVFILFLSIMDSERNISKIEIETLDSTNFDDMYFEYISDGIQKVLSYHVQAKNYPNTSIEDIEIDNSTLIIKGNRNDFNSADNNILIVNTSLISTNDTFMGLACVKKSNIIIIPLTPEQVADEMDGMLDNDARKLQLIHKADDIVENAKFVITIDELPDLIMMSTDLENDTIFIRNVPDKFEQNITFIEGKPGVGKSHYVNEICDKYPDAVVYRFWTGSQDLNNNRRIRFESFISELGIKIYRSAKKVQIEELIDTIKKENTLILIDGLDHVENYNPLQLEQFINFIDKLKNTKTVILSRPLNYNISWRKEILLDWTFEETRIYLELSYGIFDYQIQHKIFHVSDGYPIITFYLAEEYKLSQQIDLVNTIKGVNEYYDTLFVNNDKPSSAIGIFASGNCFFTFKELKSFFLEPEMYEIICEFIDTHPYLFKIVINRISLIHDSFNTYLRIKISSFIARQKATIAIIRESLLSGSIEYMARMESFHFEEEFYYEILKKYSHTDTFERLMLSTRDYNSITSFYDHLQRLLEDRKEVLDIYEYYSFVLLYQTATRNNLIGYDSWVYQMLKYMHYHEGIEDNIFSSDYIWQVFLVCQGLEKNAFQYLANRHISGSQYYELIESLNEDSEFFDKKNHKVDYGDLVKQLEVDEINLIDKKKALVEYLISVWIHGKSGDRFFNSFKKYIDNKEFSCLDLRTEMSLYGLDKFWIDTSLSSAEYHLHELGFFGKQNKFQNTSLYELIINYAHEGSFTTYSLVASYLKLANYEQRKIDISSLAYCWSMYYNRKDYSVYTIENALIAFETKGLIKQDQSFTIISKLMDQSEKGISHLLTSYANQKGREYICYLNEMEYFNKKDCQIDFWNLNSENYDCFTVSEVVTQVMNLLNVHYYSKNIEGSYIQNILKSKHKDLVLSGIKKYDYLIMSSDDYLISILEKNDMKFINTKEDVEDIYIPLSSGYIHEEDFEYIKKQKIDYLEVAQFADGWYSCLPFVDVFSLYEKKDIQKYYIKIIHNAVFARVSDNNYIGNWYDLIGNVLTFFLKYDIDVDWKELYTIFNDFLKLSQIYVPKK